MKSFCPECRKEVDYYIEKSVEKKNVREKEFEYQTERAYCTECRSEIFIPELHDENLKRIDKSYKESSPIWFHRLMGGSSKFNS